MELFLNRTYYPTGTNSDLIHEGKLLCHTIELPWVDNKRGMSCIPEGRYKLAPHESAKYGRVLKVLNVPERDAILLHKANSALKPKQQLRGCIAPVTRLDATQAGVGWDSASALKNVLALVFPALEKNEEVYLIISKK